MIKRIRRQYRHGSAKRVPNHIENRCWHSFGTRTQYFSPRFGLMENAGIACKQMCAHMHTRVGRMHIYHKLLATVVSCWNAHRRFSHISCRGCQLKRPIELLSEFKLRAINRNAERIARSFFYANMSAATDTDCIQRKLDRLLMLLKLLPFGSSKWYPHYLVYLKCWQIKMSPGKLLLHILS